MSLNPVLKAIKERRTVFRFKADDVSQEKIDAIVEAARWAPSFANSQPWDLVVVRDQETKEKLRQVAVTITRVGIEEAPILFVIAVNPKKDPSHYVEDGAAATQNMALSAHSLGLASFWVGVYDTSGSQGSSEDRIKALLNIPKGHRVISMLPVGYAAMPFSKERKPASEFIHLNRYGTTP